MTSSLGVLFSAFATAGSWDLMSLLIRVTLIAAIGAFLCALLRHASAAVRHLTAVATLAALIAFPVAKVLLPAMPLPILPAARTATPPMADPPSRAWVARTSVTPVPESSVANVAETPASAAPDETLDRALSYAILATLGVAFALLLHVLFSFVAAAITVRRARRIDDVELRRELRSACERLGVSRAVDLRESSSVTVPVVWGLFRPVLLLPVGARGWSREQLRIVFLHEVAHVARHDGVGLLLARIATSVFWFHPLVWKLARVARQECERCCDDLVIAAGERATDYAEHLLAIVRSMKTQRERLAGVAPALAQRSNLEDRLTSILRAGPRRGSVSRPAFFVAIGSAAVLLVATAVVQVVSASDTVDRPDDAVSTTCTDEDVTNAVQVSNGVEEACPNSAQKQEEGERRFQAGQEQFRQESYVRAATSYLAAGALGYRRDESFYRAGCALAKAGATDDALNALGAAVEAGHDRSALGLDSDLESLRAEPGFHALLNPNPSPDIEVSVVPMVPVVPVVPPVYQVAGSSNLWKSKEGQTGIEYMRAGQYERAITAFEGEIREGGGSNAMYNLACAYALRGDKRRAFDALENAIENGFDNSQHMAQDEDLQSLQGDPHFYQLVRLSKDLQLFNNGRFGGMNDEGDWRRALPRFERVTHEHPNVGRAWANLGFARLEGGDAKGGFSAYQRALELGYQKPTMMYNMACCASRAGDIDGAFKWLDRAEDAGFEIGEHMGTDNDLDAIRDDPRYDAMLDRWDQKMAREHREKEKTD
jgi:beta-lactamase regulating signal transducer with metallopeptidase domain/tetratricopeptide (TPR) repeat protein